MNRGSTAGEAILARDAWNVRESFWRRVYKHSSGCLIWAGAYRTRNGYGCIRIGRRTVQAHRVAMALTGRDVPAGLVVMHSCDNKACVNPDHLSIGTQLQNRRDAVARGLAVSSHKGNPRITMQIAERIRVVCAAGTLTQREVARREQVSESLVSLIVNGKAWV